MTNSNSNATQSGKVEVVKDEKENVPPTLTFAGKPHKVLRDLGNGYYLIEEYMTHNLEQSSIDKKDPAKLLNMLAQLPPALIKTRVEYFDKRSRSGWVSSANFRHILSDFENKEYRIYTPFKKLFIVNSRDTEEYYGVSSNLKLKRMLEQRSADRGLCCTWPQDD